MNVSVIGSRIMIVLVLLVLAACGEAQPQATTLPPATATTQPRASLLGKWRVVSMSENGTPVSLSDEETQTVFEFAADGVLTLSSARSGQEPQKATYTLADDSQLTMNLDMLTIQGPAQIDGEGFVLAYDQARPLNRLREVNAQGTPINREGTPVAEPSPIRDRIVMTFERVR